ncbi:MAG: hypothetical protein EOO04_05445 [Chitinophagaceae bacterium]|nr:MAG: hypothetical protein EOO04_05445 [Chitinophagaceae bacterium]
MKQLRILSLLTAVALLMFSCQKELSVENGKGSGGGSQWEFTEGSTFKGFIDTAYLEPSGTFQSLAFEGTSGDGNGQIFLQIYGTTITATSYKNPNVFFEYTEGSSTRYSNVPTNPDAFTVVITSLDANMVTGTFSGEVIDSTGQAKTITNGTFSAALNRNPGNPGQGVCKLQNLGFFDLTTGLSFASISNQYNSANLITKVQFYDSANNRPFESFDLVYSTNRIDIDTAQYFELDANGRVTAFHGYVDAEVNAGYPKVIIRYTYDGNGYMTKASYALPVAPAITVQEINYTWTNGNLTKSVISTPNSLEKVEVDYEYDLTKAPKEFLCLFPNYEIVYMQSAIDYGRNSTNVLTRSRVTNYDATTGAPTATTDATYENYVIDAENYVRSFDIRGNGGLLPGDTKYVLSYNCF